MIDAKKYLIMFWFVCVLSAMKIHLSDCAERALRQIGGYVIIPRGKIEIKVIQSHSNYTFVILKRTTCKLVLF